ncbi:O-acetyltransferase [Penicillium cinerascens]|uniref:O-acetyltransferase n=1 Tax=Penicillium cinerascens TaxID=70096 RepID=A0A9W9NFK6_9EURO|nr:O-acetyltransferase [Penicillium cinerascens]KAJ5219029.1 O-acetyltransferase [Penicillium cinerascens]
MVVDSFELSSLDQTIWHNYYGLDSLSFRVDNPDTAALTLQAAVDRLLQALPFLTSEVIHCPQLGNKRNLKQLRHNPTLSSEVPIFRVVSHTGMVEEVTQSVEFSPLPLLLPLSQRQVVVRFQANIFANGLLLCMNFNHCVFDGTGAALILQYLASLCRHDPSIEKHLSHILRKESFTRKKLNVIGIPQVPANAQDPIPPESFGTGEYDTLLTQLFKFSNRHINHLKHQCQQHLDALGKSHFLSRNDVVSALLAFFIKRARVMNKGIHDVSVSLPVNLRSKQPEIFPPMYMGNSFTSLHVQSKVDVTSPIPAISQIALEIRRQINMVNKGYIEDMLGQLNCLQDYAEYPWRPFDLELSSWRDLAIYDLDFGPELGKVVDYHANPGSHDGCAFIFPVKGADSKHADWEISLTLAKDTMRRFSEDLVVFTLSLTKAGL